LPQVNSGRIVLPENLERFHSKSGCFGQLNKVKWHFAESTAFLEWVHSRSEHNMLFFPQVPFANLGLWKHSFAITAKLWVKLQNGVRQ